MAERLPQTPSQTVGPFFHEGLLLGGENVLVNDRTKGQRILITGTVYDGDGVPVPDALIELWQADAAGIFKHPEDPQFERADPEFAGFGRSGTVRDGAFTFETVKPGKSPLDDEAQAPYVRVRVFSRGLLVHATTRLYFSDEENGQDPILKGVPEARRETLVATLEPTRGLPSYRFDIHLQGDEETVFFDV